MTGAVLKTNYLQELNKEINFLMYHAIAVMTYLWIMYIQCMNQVVTTIFVLVFVFVVVDAICC